MSDRVILCYGDSNTHGTAPMPDLDGAGRYGPRERWPGVMAADLGKGWSVIEEGHPGRTTIHDDPLEGAWKNGMSLLPAILETHLPVDLVILKLGTNDLKARFSVTANDIARSVEKLGLAVKASGAGPGGRAPALLVIAPPPIQEVGCLAGTFEGGRAKSLRFPAEFALAAARLGAAYLDAGTLIAVDPVDGIHYDKAAHLTLGKAIAALVRQTWAKT